MRHTSFTLILAIFVVSSGLEVHGQTARSARTSEGVWIIQYEVEDGVLSYAVIAGPSKEAIEGLVTPSSTSLTGPFGKVHEVEKRAVFRHPNGNEVDLVGTGRVIHVSSEIVSELVNLIDPETFEAFLRSGSDDFGLPALLEFKASLDRNEAVAEQGGAEQPATLSESDSEGSDKPQPESEGGSR